MSYQFVVARRPGHLVAELRQQVRPHQAGEDFGAGFRELYTELSRAGLHPAGPPQTRYPDGFPADGSAEVLLGVPVTGSTGDRPAGLALWHAMPGLFASTTHYGDYAGLSAAYTAFAQWLPEAGWRTTGPATEVYLCGPTDTADPREFVTEIQQPVARAIGLTEHSPLDVPATLPLVREALSEQDFGVLTEIDVQAVLRAKLGREIEEYVILGACNPGLASQALDADRQIGLLLPCNVVVRADGGGSLIEAANPDMLVQLTDLDALRPIADEATLRLSAALRRARELTGQAQQTAGEAS